jgi:hypothetical protein
MLVCGQVNPPPVRSHGYNGVFFTDQDDLATQARGLVGTPLCVEHQKQVGKVLRGWTDRQTGAMWALAEIDTQQLGGAMTAAAVERGQLGEFSLGYVTKMQRDGSGQVRAKEKRITELSIVKKGARDGCLIEMKEDCVHGPKKERKRA